MNLRRTITRVALTGALTLSALGAVSAPASAELPCEWNIGSQPQNYPLDGVACVVMDTTSGIRLVGVTNVQPGWTYQVKSAGGTTASDNNRVEIRFDNPSTGQRLDFRYEPGKTKIG
jgi:hypothetical protein